jgi:hypothetical protein
MIDVPEEIIIIFSFAHYFHFLIRSFVHITLQSESTLPTMDDVPEELRPVERERATSVAAADGGDVGGDAITAADDDEKAIAAAAAATATAAASVAAAAAVVAEKDAAAAAAAAASGKITVRRKTTDPGKSGCKCNPFLLLFRFFFCKVLLVVFVMHAFMRTRTSAYTCIHLHVQSSTFHLHSSLHFQSLPRSSSTHGYTCIHIHVQSSTFHLHSSLHF